MLLTCSCGKSLTVSPALLGKTMTCPACHAALVVAEHLMRPSELPKTSTPEITSVQNGSQWHETKLRAGAKLQDESRTSPDGQALLNDTGSGKTAKTERAEGGRPKSNLALWLVISGSVFFLAVTAVLAGAAWIISHQGADAEKRQGPPEVPMRIVIKQTPMVVKLFVPHRKGDRREITAKKFTESWLGDATATPYLHKNEGMLFVSNHLVQLSGQVRILEINAKGEETRIELTVSAFVYGQLSKEPRDLSINMIDSKLVPTGTVYVGDLSDSGYTWRDSKGSVPASEIAILNEFVPITYLQAMEVEADALFKPDKKLTAGSTWPLLNSKIINYLERHNILGVASLPQVLELNGKGNGEINDVFMEPEREEVYMYINLNVDFSYANFKESLTGQGNCRLRFPGNGSTGPLMKSETICGTVWQKDGQAKISYRTIADVTIKYY